jgi:hypothetical protein
VVILWTVAGEVLSSNLDWETDYPDWVVMVFLNPSRQMPGEYLN